MHTFDIDSGIFGCWFKVIANDPFNGFHCLMKLSSPQFRFDFFLMGYAGFLKVLEAKAGLKAKRSDHRKRPITSRCLF